MESNKDILPVYKCANYKVCNNSLPAWWEDRKGSYTCINCSLMLFGTLKFINDIECPVCMKENVIGVNLSNCSHAICIDCFKRCHYVQEPQELPFPYPNDIEQRYFDDTDNPIWDSEYPLIKVWNEHIMEQTREADEKYENEEYLRKCPICRQ